MHPLVARIHPSFRTAFFAWFLGRAALWIAIGATGFSPLDAVDTGGTIGPWLAEVAEFTSTHAPWNNAGEWLRFALNEIAVLVGLVGLYRFVRRDAMPQGADRAVWFAALSPLMAFTLTGSDWSFAFALSMWALELASGATTAVWGVILYLGAVLFRPELIVLWPGFTAVAWRSGSSDSAQTWVATLMPLVVFAGRVIWEVLAGNPRSLYNGDTHWRTDFAWHGFEHHLVDLGIVGLMLAGLALAIRYAGQRPKSWLLIAVPCLVWPVLQEPSASAAAILLVAASSFGHLGAYTEDAGRERFVLASSLVGLVALALSF